MILSMAAFALADTLVKVTSETVSAAQILFFLIGSGLFLFALSAKLQGNKLLDRKAFAPILMMRYVSEVIGMISMVTALSLAPLSTVGAITQATPLLVVIGAVLFLGEKVSWRRWSAIAAGFVGVLLIVQPGGESFNASVLWAVLAMFGLSARDLTTRLTPPDVGSFSLATFTMAAALPFAVIWVLYNGESLFPAEVNWWVVAAMCCFGATGYILLIISLRMTEVAIVTPFRYSRIIFLLILGVVVFDERPSISMLFGAALIVASGIYLMWREQQIKKSNTSKSEN